jgi:membrane fusion protein, macrolide-specific efflux system
MRKKKVLWAAVLLSAVAAVFFYRRAKTPGGAPSFKEVPVERGDLEVSVQATGVVQPRNRLEIKPPIAGRVEDVLVREGQSVRRGQVLGWMSSSERAALLDAARAKGPEEVARWSDLYKPTPLLAPLDGTLIARNVEPGQTVAAQDAVLVLSDRLIVKAQVDETDIARVSTGQDAAVALDAYPDRPVRAKVEHVAYEAKTVSNVTIYEVDVLPASVPEEMRSGMTANVTFVLSRKEGVLLIPSEAVRAGEGGEKVFVPSGDKKGRPDHRKIKTGLTDGKNTEVLEGLEEGDVVLIHSFNVPGSKTAGSNPFMPNMRGGRGQRGGQGAQGGRRP